MPSGIISTNWLSSFLWVIISSCIFLLLRMQCLSNAIGQIPTPSPPCSLFPSPPEIFVTDVATCLVSTFPEPALSAVFSHSSLAQFPSQMANNSATASSYQSQHFSLYVAPVLSLHPRLSLHFLRIQSPAGENRVFPCPFWLWLCMNILQAPVNPASQTSYVFWLRCFSVPLVLTAWSSYRVK